MPYFELKYTACQVGFQAEFYPISRFIVTLACIGKCKFRMKIIYIWHWNFDGIDVKYNQAFLSKFCNL